VSPLDPPLSVWYSISTGDGEVIFFPSMREGMTRDSEGFRSDLDTLVVSSVGAAGIEKEGPGCGRELRAKREAKPVLSNSLSPGQDTLGPNFRPTFDWRPEIETPAKLSAGNILPSGFGLVVDIHRVC